MRYRLPLLVCLANLVFGSGCIDKDEKKTVPAAETKPSTAPVAAIDAAPPTTTKPEITAPLTGTHLDGAGSAYQPSTPRPRIVLSKKSEGKAIELVLRSTPPGAIAAIDGKPIGNTPTFWQGTADGQPHEYTFTKNGYSIARYRFVATQSGVVHGSLKALVQPHVTGNKAAPPVAEAAPH